MGLNLTVRFPAGTLPAWEAVKGQLARLGEPAPLRMIDGLPAFPDEAPETNWRELRIGFATGMVTLQRTGDTLTCVIWSNADQALLAARDRLAWACAEAGQGMVETDQGALSAEAFTRLCGLEPS
jgi:hypothetical protein